VRKGKKKKGKLKRKVNKGGRKCKGEKKTKRDRKLEDKRENRRNEIATEEEGKRNRNK
jgi:hypothetical protein